MNYFIHQLDDNDCGPACVKMLMANIYKSSSYLYYPDAYCMKNPSLRDLMKLALREGIKLSVSRIEKKEDLFKEKINSPFLATLVENKTLHMVMIKKVKPKSILVYDPKRGIHWCKKEEFISKWNGYLMEVVSAEERREKYKVRKLDIIPRPLICTTLVFQLLSLLSLLMAMFFIDKNYSYIIPIILFSLYIVFEFIYQRTIMASLKSFDDRILVQDFMFNRDKFKEYYEPMSKFKIILISSPIKLLASIVIIVFGIFILGINSLYNLIILGLIFGFQILFKYLDKRYLEIHRTDLENLEKDLFKDEKLDDIKFKEQVLNLNHESYQIVSYMNLKKYFMLFITIALCLVYQAITGFMSINFMLFHVFLYVYLQENFDKILETSKIIEQYRYYKCLYLYHFR